MSNNTPPKPSNKLLTSELNIKLLSYLDLMTLHTTTQHKIEEHEKDVDICKLQLTKYPEKKNPSRHNQAKSNLNQAETLLKREKKILHEIKNHLPNYHRLKLLTSLNFSQTVQANLSRSP